MSIYLSFYLSSVYKCTDSSRNLFWPACTVELQCLARFLRAALPGSREPASHPRVGEDCPRFSSHLRVVLWFMVACDPSCVLTHSNFFLGWLHESQEFLESLRAQLQTKTCGTLLEELGDARPCVSIKASATDAAKVMQSSGSGGVLVMLEGQRKLVGIFTTKDLLYRVVAAARNPGGQRAQSHMFRAFC